MQVNYPNEYDYTRIVEIKHATGQTIDATTIVREYPEDYFVGREPYYPIPAPDTRALYARYAERGAAEMNVTFVGRLATYRYYIWIRSSAWRSRNSIKLAAKGSGGYRGLSPGGVGFCRYTYACGRRSKAVDSARLDNASIRPRCGESVHTGSVSVASPRISAAWQRQPPKSMSRSGHDRQGSLIHFVPRKRFEALRFRQIQARNARVRCQSAYPKWRSRGARKHFCPWGSP
jgi:hypothetical protein